MNKLSVVRRVPVLIGLAVVAAAVLVSAGSAGTATKPYAANICDSSQLQPATSTCPKPTTPPASLTGGAAVAYLTIYNEANPQTLGSANIGLPTGPSPTTYALGSASLKLGTGTVTSSSTLITLRNLNLSPGGSVTVQFTLNTPVCTTGTYDWGGAIRIKQSNDFNGPPGNDFTRDSANSRLTATLSGGGCHLAIVPDDSNDLTHQPKDTVKNDPITDGLYSSGNPVQVGVYDSSHTLIDLSGSCPSGPGCVSVVYTGGDSTATLTGTKNQALVHGIASFGDLKLDKTSTVDYALTFSSAAITGTTSDGFAIVDDGCTATNGSCTVTGAFPKSGSTPTTTADATATFTGAGGLSLRFFLQGTPPAGCANFIGTGSAGVDTSVQGTTTGFLITYGLSDKALKQAYGTNYGQPNVPICVGAQRVENGQTYTCQQDILRGKGGWTGRVLGADGKPNGQFDVADCGSDGLWWNIAPTFQDTPPASFPAISIVISQWGTGTASDGTSLRMFTIFKPPPWDSKCFG